MAQLAVRSLLLFLLLVSPFVASAGIVKLNSSSPLFGIEFPRFNTAVADTGCDGRLVAAKEEVEEEEKQPVASVSPSLKLHMSHRAAADAAAGRTRKDSFLDSAKKDAVRIDTMHRRAARAAPASSSPRRALSERLVATVESGVAVGSGEYLVDVYVGTPPRQFQPWPLCPTGRRLSSPPFSAPPRWPQIPALAVPWSPATLAPPLPRSLEPPTRLAARRHVPQAVRPTARADVCSSRCHHSPDPVPLVAPRRTWSRRALGDGRPVWVDGERSLPSPPASPSTTGLLSPYSSTTDFPAAELHLFPKSATTAELHPPATFFAA